MTDDPSRELVDHIRRLLQQAADPAAPPVPRITAVLAIKPYVESLTRQLVEDARRAGSSWDDLAAVFATSAANLQLRFGDMRSYDDEPS